MMIDMSLVFYALLVFQLVLIVIGIIVLVLKGDSEDF